jgi:hypothetical protein
MNNGGQQLVCMILERQNIKYTGNGMLFICLFLEFLLFSTDAARMLCLYDNKFYGHKMHPDFLRMNIIMIALILKCNIVYKHDIGDELLEKLKIIAVHLSLVPSITTITLFY